MLKLNNAWRFNAPAVITTAVSNEFSVLIGKIATQGDRRVVLEHFKDYFAKAAGYSSTGSSSESWAETDLDRYMCDAAANAPLFVAAFYDACEALGKSEPEFYFPDVAVINCILAEHGVPFEIQPPNLIARKADSVPIPILSALPQPTQQWQKATEPAIFTQSAWSQDTSAGNATAVQRFIPQPGREALPPSGPVDIFFSYAHEDEQLMQEVRRQFVIFERQGLITKWHDRMIPAGADWKDRIDYQLSRARIVLLFVSPHFFDSDYCYEAEMKEALNRHKLGQAKVIPIILRPCPWHETPLGQLQALPTDGKPITTWPDRDQASLDVARGVMRIVQQL